MRLRTLHRKTTFLCLLLSVFLLSPPLTASHECWTAAGGAAIVEPDTAANAKLSNDLRFSPTAPGNVIAANYNITATDEISSIGSAIEYTVRFKDDGSDSHVNIQLKAVGLTGGGQQILVDFNSDNFADSPNPQTLAGLCAVTGPFDFATKTYYLNVRLVRNSPTADPRFYGFKVCDGSGPCS